MALKVRIDVKLQPAYNWQLWHLAGGHCQMTIGYAVGEENYRQLMTRIKTPHDATLALTILSQGRKARAVLQQHTPYTFLTSQLFIQVSILIMLLCSCSTTAIR